MINHLFGTVLNPDNKIIENVKIDTTNTQIHDGSLSCLGTYTSITIGVAKLVLWASLRK